ncbi:MAG: cation transporter [Gemmatimonadaceae bacterium]
MESLTLVVSGMSCGHCVARVENALKSIPGVTVGTVSIGAASVSFDPQQTSATAISKAVADAGYPAQPAGRAA